MPMNRILVLLAMLVVGKRVSRKLLIGAFANLH